MVEVWSKLPRDRVESRILHRKLAKSHITFIIWKFTIAYQGTKFGNTLPSEFKDESSKHVLRQNFHRFLVQQANLS